MFPNHSCLLRLEGLGDIFDCSNSMSGFFGSVAQDFGRGARTIGEGLVTGGRVAGTSASRFLDDAVRLPASARGAAAAIERQLPTVASAAHGAAASIPAMMPFTADAFTAVSPIISHPSVGSAIAGAQRAISLFGSGRASSGMRPAPETIPAVAASAPAAAGPVREPYHGPSRSRYRYDEGIEERKRQMMGLRQAQEARKLAMLAERAAGAGAGAAASIPSRVSIRPVRPDLPIFDAAPRTGPVPGAGPAAPPPEPAASIPAFTEPDIYEQVAARYAHLRGDVRDRAIADEVEFRERTGINPATLGGGGSGVGSSAARPKKRDFWGIY